MSLEAARRAVGQGHEEQQPMLDCRQTACLPRLCTPGALQTLPLAVGVGGQWERKEGTLTNDRD